MKNCIIISTYPCNEYRLSILKNALKTFKKYSENVSEKFDIILCSQYPITDKEILSSIDYFLLDCDDIESFYYTDEVYTYDFHYWNYINNITFVDIFDNTYHFMLWKLVYMSLNFANNMGYDFFYYMEGDFEIESEKFFDKIIKLKYDSINKDKDFVLFNINDDVNSDFFNGHVYGGRIKSFLDNDIPFDKENWVKDNYCTSTPLEKIMYDKIYSSKPMKINKIYLNDELSIFNDIKINILHYPLCLATLFYYNNTYPDNLFIFLLNNDKEEKIIKIYLDDNIYLDMIFYHSVYYYNNILIKDIMNKKIKLTIHQNNMLFFEKEYFLDEKRLEYIKKKGLYTIN